MKSLCLKINRIKSNQAYRSLYSFNKFFMRNLINTAKVSALDQNKTVFVDCRPEEAFKKGHIKGAVNMHSLFTFLSESSETGMTTMANTFNHILQAKGLTGNENLVIYEDNIAALKGVSCRGYYMMNLFGYDDSKLFILEDGFDAWKKSFPDKVEQGDEIFPTKPGTFTVKYNKNNFVDYKQVLEAVNKKTALLDVRDFEEWVGDSSSPYGPDFTPRKGRIPGAKHVLWTDLMKEDGSAFKSDKEIEEIIKKTGINKDDNVIVYCFKGCRSSNSYVALKKAGFKNVKNYFASWNEWSRDHSLPVDNTKIKI